MLSRLLSLIFLLTLLPPTLASSSCANPSSSYATLKSPHSSKDSTQPVNLGLLPRGNQLAIKTRVANLDRRITECQSDLDRYTLMASIGETDSELVSYGCYPRRMLSKKDFIQECECH